MIPRRSIELINIFRAHSEILATDVEFILTEACKPEGERNCAGHDVTVERLKDLLVYISLADQSGSMPHFYRFIVEGFDRLRNELDWANIEQDLFYIELKKIHTRRGGSILSALMHLARTFFRNQKLCPPSVVATPNNEKTIDISRMYFYPSNRTADFKKFAEKILQLPNAYSKYKAGISLLQKVLTDARNEPTVANIIKNCTVSEAIDNDEFYATISSRIQKDDLSRLNKIRCAHNPEIHGYEKKNAKNTPHTLTAGKESRGAQWIHELSPKWLEECQSYVNYLYKNYGQKSAISAITRLTKFSSAVFDYRENLDSLDRLRNDGISAFFDYNKILIRSIYKIQESRIISTIGEICSMHNHLYKSDWTTSDLNDLVIRFDCDSGDDRHRTVILDSLATKYPLIAQSIYDYAQYELSRIDGEQRARDTVFSTTSLIRNVFVSHLDMLDRDDHDLLTKYGVAALEKNNCRIVKRIRNAINEKYKNDALELGTATGIQSAFKSFCSHYKLTEVKSYGVSGRRRRANQFKSKASDYYSKEDVATIAYAIELALMSDNLSDRDNLLLRLARILLKTGWNLTPLLMLEIDDILKLDAPITGKTAHFVRLFKKRGNYKTQFYEFEMSSDNIQQEGLVFGSEVTNALADLEYIRDEISSKHRPSLPATSKLKYRLSLYREDDGTILAPAHTKFSTLLNEILHRHECKISFSVQRIRKGGLNYIYKTYAKNFKEYKEAGQHSLKVFLDAYLRNDGIKSEETLSSATKVMSDYFAGRPLSEDIIIVTEIPPDTKKTPSGVCASNGNDDESRAFEKQQQRLNRSSNTTSSQCGDFNACLFCRHFRLVADAEHVWRLLSYHRYVVGGMELGVSDYSNTTEQATYVEVLNKRIETMLNELREINNDAVEKGISLLEEKGCHEDWAFYASIGVAT